MVKRFRGDTHPMVWELKINDSPADLREVSLSEFSYNLDGNIITIEGVISDATNGLVKFLISDTDFDTPGKFEFDIQLTYNDGTKRTFIKDIIVIEDDINKR
jgi:hypothetical protein